MIKLIPIKYRTAIARWLLSGDGPMTEHSIVHYDAETVVLQSEHQYDLRMALNRPDIYSQLKKDVTYKMIEGLIESDFMKIEYEDDYQQRLGRIRARLRVVKITD